VAFQKIGILSIGEMGYHWALILKEHGVEVMTSSRGRSEVTQKRAENAGVKSVPLARLVNEVDLIVSIVVPSAARKIAAQVGKALVKTGRKNCLYLDANAISPMTASAIEQALSPAQASFVDGCIIGSAARLAKAVVYVSGPRAEELRGLQDSGFSVQVLGSTTGQASAFKIVYAGLTKGLQALLTELLIGARKFDLLQEIMRRYDESFPGLVSKVGSGISSLPIHAGRRAEEMRELRATFRHHGLKAIIAPGTQKILAQIAELNSGKPSETGGREGDLLETLELFFQRGLLQEGSSSAARESA
jgi:3-hydroxyisobutyrate dehydrogenase-like beta-hydroxyacid dehydrogenase